MVVSVCLEERLDNRFTTHTPAHNIPRVNKAHVTQNLDLI